jgi:hypothetical protein
METRDRCGMSDISSTAKLRLRSGSRDSAYLPRSKEVLRPNLPANPGDHQRCMFMIWSMGIML